MKVYDIYAHIRTRLKDGTEKKEEEFEDGPYQCPKEAQDVLEETNKEKKSTKYVIKDNTTIHTSFQLKKRNATEQEQDQIMQEEWELEQIEKEEKEEAKIVKPTKRKSFADDDEKRTVLTIFPQEKENEACLEAKTQY